MLYLFSYICSPWCDDTPETTIDWAGMSSDCIVEATLRRDYLLVKLQELVDSKSAETAQAAIQAMDAAVAEDEITYLRFLQQAGTLKILHQVLNRDKEGPSPLVAAPLLYKFAKHDIGFQRTVPQTGRVVACERK
jgi:hypothetical protein